MNNRCRDRKRPIRLCVIRHRTRSGLLSEVYRPGVSVSLRGAPAGFVLECLRFVCGGRCVVKTRTEQSEHAHA